MSVKKSHERSEVNTFQEGAVDSAALYEQGEGVQDSGLRPGRGEMLLDKPPVFPGRGVVIPRSRLVISRNVLSAYHILYAVRIVARALVENDKAPAALTNALFVMRSVTLVVGMILSSRYPMLPKTMGVLYCGRTEGR